MFLGSTTILTHSCLADVIFHVNFPLLNRFFKLCTRVYVCFVMLLFHMSIFFCLFFLHSKLTFRFGDCRCLTLHLVRLDTSFECESTKWRWMKDVTGVKSINTHTKICIFTILLHSCPFWLRTVKSNTRTSKYF